MTGAQPEPGTDPPNRPATHVAQLLGELIGDPRDAGYEEAARRRGGQPSNRWYDRPAVAVGALIAGFVLALAYVHAHRSAPETAKVHQSLVDRVHAAQSQADRLAATARSLNSSLNAERASALPSGGGALAAQLRREQLLAGELAVTGPGLQVVLDEPPAPSPTAQPGRAGTKPITATNILTDRDVRSVVNELWSDGAEAIAVNGVRLTPTSAIRFAGQAVLVDFQPIAAPYTIDAIGAADQLDTAFAASEVASRYQTLAGAEGIGFEFTEQQKLSLPASPAAAMRYAHVPSPSPTRGTR